ncbi:hypothetical protein [Mesomycoplasma ovipneumoniae]|uniref:hypothetical protein n=1 Tax=Mesomycoplasma ovipneumoniae TaxID=29562 RepID=UPI0030810BA6
MKINNKNIKKIIGLSSLTNLTFASLLISVPVITVISQKNWHQKDSTSLAYPEFPSFKAKIHFLVNLNMKKHP